jgi:hypothetical protein
VKAPIVLAATAVAALAVAGLAVAHGFDGNKTAKAVTGTFTATTASRVETRTCTTTDGKTLTSTNGTYTGTAAGDPDFTGPVTIQARSLINTTDNVGVVTGTLKIDVASGEDTRAQFDAVYAGGQVAGLAEGHAQDPHVKLLANLSSGFSATGGFNGGKLGGTTGGGAVEVGPGSCKPTAPVKETSKASGTVSAVSSTSITVAGLTCAVPSTLQAKLNALALAVGGRAEIRCSLVACTNTLVDVNARHK